MADGKQQKPVAFGTDGQSFLVMLGNDDQQTWKFNPDTGATDGPLPVQVWLKFGTWEDVIDQPDLSGFNPTKEVV